MIATVVLLGGLSVSASAQCGGNPLITHIPFQFSIGNAMLPAGEYLVKCLGLDQHQVMFQSADGKATAIVPMVVVRGPSDERARLVFHRYGTRYFLVQAWTGGGNGLELPTTRAEAAARELAGTKPERDTIALNARR